jgi:hypothetical protein
MNTLQKHIMDEAINKVAKSMMESFDPEKIIEACLQKPEFVASIGASIVTQMGADMFPTGESLVKTLVNNNSFMASLATLLTPTIALSIDADEVAAKVVERMSEDDDHANDVAKLLQKSAQFNDQLEEMIGDSVSGCIPELANNIDLTNLSYHIELDYDIIHESVDYNEVAHHMCYESMAEYIDVEDVAEHIDEDDVTEQIYSKIVSTITGEDDDRASSWSTAWWMR